MRCIKLDGKDLTKTERYEVKPFDKLGRNSVIKREVDRLNDKVGRGLKIKINNIKRQRFSM